MTRALIVAMVAGLGILGVTAPAQAADRCASRTEFRELHKGMTAQHAADIIGYAGKLQGRYDEPGFHSVTREYKACGGGVVLLDMQREKVSQPYRITAKFVVYL